MNIERTCSICGQPNGRGARELRPYGKNGEDICAECMFGDTGIETEAKQQLGKILDQPGPHFLDENGIRSLRRRRGKR